MPRGPFVSIRRMIIDGARGTVWLGPKDDGNPHGLAVLTPGVGTLAPDPDFPDWHPVALSPDGALVALTRDVLYRGTSRSELVVLRVADRAVLLRTKRHLVFDIAFAPDGQHVLVEAFRTKPRRYRLDEGSSGAPAVDTEQDLGPIAVDVRQYCGDQDPVTGRIVVPSERARGRIHVVDIVTGSVEDVRLPSRSRVGALAYVADGERVVLVLEDETVHCLDRDWSPVWSVDMSVLPDGPGGLWAGGVVVPSDGGLFCLSASSTARNSWGTDYVLDAADGTLLRRIEGYHLRGRIRQAYLGTSVLVYGARILELATGVLGDDSIIPGYVAPLLEPLSFET